MYKALDIWLLPYLLRRRKRQFSKPTDIMLCICDHFEPLHATNKKGSSTFSVVLAQYPLLRRRNLSTYFERYYRNV